MSKNFNLSIPKKRLRTARFKWGKYFSSAAFSGAALSLVLAGALILPQTAQAENENVSGDGGTTGCTIDRGTITTSPQSATFAPGDTDTDIDFKITCTGALHAHLNFESIKKLFEDRAAETKADNTAAYDREESITMIDLSAVTGNGLSFALDPAPAILKGMLTNGASITDRRAVEVYTGVSDSYDIDAENRATIVVQGDGRVAIAAYRHEDDTSGGGITLNNFGDITTEGGTCVRTDSESTCYNSEYTGDHPYRRANGIHAGIDNPVATGDVMVTNEGATATITVEGDGASGLDAYNSGTGNAEVVNSGAVITKGALWEPVKGKKYRPRAVSAWANSGSATATNEAGGEVTTGVMGDATKGQEGNAVSASTGDDDVPISGAAMATNEGEITTYGANARGLHASTDADDPGKATVMNAATGTITTHGAEAHGMSTWVSGLPGTTHEAEGTNAGTITTNGDRADGMQIFASDSLNGDSEVTVTNAGTITVNGADRGTNGISTGFYMDRDDGVTAYVGDALGTVMVTNTGTVIATGNGARAIDAGFYTDDDGLGNRIRNSGNVKIDIAGGTVMASGDGSTALYAETHGTGMSTITIQNGAKVSAVGSDGSGDAVWIIGAGTLNLFASSLVGDVTFAGRENQINITNQFNIKPIGSGSIDGNINFFGQDDTMEITIVENQHFVINGEIMGPETMNKKGPGFLRLNGAVVQGDVLNLDQGVLVIAGNLEANVVTVKDAGKLVFEITDKNNYGSVTAGSVHFEKDDPVVFAQRSKKADSSTPESDISGTALTIFTVDVDNNNNPMVTTGSNKNSVTMITVQSESSDGTADVGMVVIDEMTGKGSVTFDKASADQVAELVMPGSTTPPPGGSSSGSGSGSSGGGSTPTGTAAASSGSSGGGGAILGIGLLAVLLNSFLGDDDASASFGDYYFNTPQSAYIAQANERGVMTIKETGNQPYQMWIRTGQTAQPMRMTGVSNTGVSGTEVGVNLYNSDTFYINTSVAPNVSAEVGSLNLAGKGEVYSLSSGWRNDRYFGGLRVSHGEFEVNSIVDNPIVNSALISNAKLRNTQAQLRAGMNLSTGALRFTPSASIQVGTYENSEHVAESPALEATIPSYTQDYTSVQLGLKMTSEKWLSFTNGSKWKPQLKFDSIHTDSKDAGSLTLRQSDKAGALSFNTNAGLRSMPDVVNSMSFGAKVKSSANDQAEWKFGFAGLEADGEEYYAAMAAYQLRF